jgi:hypothetical protein
MASFGAADSTADNYAEYVLVLCCQKRRIEIQQLTALSQLNTRIQPSRLYSQLATPEMPPYLMHSWDLGGMKQDETSLQLSLLSWRSCGHVHYRA